MNKIKEVIRNSGLRKNYIAKQMDIVPSNISMWITEERKIPKARIRQLCKIVGCKVKDLFPEGVK